MVIELFNRHSLQTVLKYLLNYLSTFGYRILSFIRVAESSIGYRESSIENMQNKPNLVHRRRILNERKYCYKKELCLSAEALAKAETNPNKPKQSQNKAKTNPIQSQFIVCKEADLLIEY